MRAAQKVVNDSLSEPQVSQGFPKQARLLNATEYAWVLQRGQRKTKTGALSIKTSPNRLNRPRLGLVVPKRGTPKAHDRNRIKRVIREEFRLAQPKLPSIDVVVQVFRDVPKQQLSAALAKEFDNLAAPTRPGAL